MAINNMYRKRKFCKVWTAGFQDTRAKQRNVHTGRSTLHPQSEG